VAGKRRRFTTSAVVYPHSVSDRVTLMKIMIRKTQSGTLTAYVPKKDLEEPVVSMQNPTMWGGIITLANGWELELPQMDADTRLPVTVEARKVAG
jgi:nitrogen fixation protein NifT